MPCARQANILYGNGSNSAIFNKNIPPFTNMLLWTIRGLQDITMTTNLCHKHVGKAIRILVA